MSIYKVDERDVHFNVFEYLKLQDFTSFEHFKDHNEDLYRMVITEALKFTMNELDPLYVSGDREGCHMIDGKVKTPKGFKEAYAKFAANGFIGVDRPTTYGGQGLPVLLYSALAENFTGSNVSFYLYAGLSRGSAFLIETFGSKELADLFCEKMYNGTWGGTMCLTEPQAGTAVGDLRSSAKKNDDGTYSIQGSKIFISSGDHDLTENNIHLFLARVEGDPAGTKGISLFVVPKYWVNPDGSLGEANDVNCVNVEHKMGIKGSATCSLNFGEAGKCRGFLLGEQSKGMRMMFQMMNEARLLCGIQGQSLAGSAYENARAYAKDRIQGNNTAIIKYPNIRYKLSWCKALVEGMRGLLYMTGKSLDVADAHPDAETRRRAKNRTELLTPICKAYCSDMGFRVTEVALQIYGGYGYTSEYPAEQFARDVKIASIYEGTNGIQALDLMGRKLAINNGELFREFYEDLSAFCAQHEANDGLAPEFASLKKAIDTIAQVAMKLAEWGMGGEPNKALLSANNFLEMMGHAVLSYVLLDQSLIAQAAIKAGKSEVFYQNKIRTAQFFSRQILPQVQMRAKSILSEDLSAMEIDF